MRERNHGLGNLIDVLDKSMNDLSMVRQELDRISQHDYAGEVEELTDAELENEFDLMDLPEMTMEDLMEESENAVEMLKLKKQMTEEV